jgi:Contractile injection system tube protein
MPDSMPLVKAQLQELDANYKHTINKEKWTTIQFNPDMLKVSFANQIATPSGPGDQQGTASRQFVGAGTTKLSVQIWFDCTAPIPQGALEDNRTETNDVRKLTQRVAYFITPRETTDKPPKHIPPAVRFVWGSFQFDGIMESLEESLEFFSNDGRPLRASMSLSLSQQKIQKFAFAQPPATPPGSGGPGGAPAGTRPLAEVQAGITLPGLAASVGKGDNWQVIASANGVENPRILAPGRLVDLNIS